MRANDPEEIGRLGEQIYTERIRHAVEAGNEGRFLAIDIHTARYVIADDDVTATQRLLEHDPEAVVYGLRIGWPSAYRLRGSVLAYDGPTAPVAVEDWEVLK